MNDVRSTLFRDAGRHPNGAKLMSFVGIIPIPDHGSDDGPKGEHQYTVTVKNCGDHLYLDVLMTPESEIDRTEMARGCGIGHLLVEPIWRMG
jgi:hypothetical protein